MDARLEQIFTRIRVLNREALEGPFASEAESALDDAERRLGCKLPPDFRALMRTLGPIYWPISFRPPAGLEREAEAPWSSTRVQFASDGSELQYLFVQEAADEVPGVVVWDLELPDESQDLEPCAFVLWLEDAIDTAWRDAREARKTALQRKLDALPIHLFGPPASEEALDALEEKWGHLPEAYRWFHERYGPALYPVELLPCGDVENLDGTPMFAREAAGVLYALERDVDDAEGDVWRVRAKSDGSTPLVPGLQPDFIAWLEAALSARAQQEAASAARPKPKPAGVQIRRRPK